jgi:phosphoenolpyruvate carboxylase
MNHEDIQFPTRHHPLREDIRALAQLMDDVLREQGGAELWQLVEQDRLTAIRWREGVAGAAEALAVRVRGRPPRVARELVRAFSSGAGGPIFSRTASGRSPAAWWTRSPSSSPRA